MLAANAVESPVCGLRREAAEQAEPFGRLPRLSAATGHETPSSGRCYMKHRCLVVLILLVCSIGTAALAQTEDKASATFYRPKRFMWSGLTPSIYVDGKQVLRLDNGRYYTLRLPAGKHTLDSSMKKHAPLEVELKAGESAYFEMVLLGGMWRGGGRLIPTPESNAKEAIAKLKPLDAKWVSK